MSDQFKDTLPKESEAQQIGHYAHKCFIANIPHTWRPNQLDGDSDFGYDYQIQIIVDGLATGDVFRVQLKGTTTPKLVDNSAFFSQTIRTSTANFYGFATEPVLLVLCDLSVNPHIPKDCPLYFVWVNDELERLNEFGIQKEQKTLTFKIPKSNILTSTTDFTPHIKKYRNLTKIGRELYGVVESGTPHLTETERTNITNKVVGNLNRKSPALIDALARDDSSWIEAPHGSLQWHLKEGLNALQRGNGSECESSLHEASKLITTANDLEKADYWNLVGRLKVFNLDDEAAKDAFKKACDLSGNIERHLIPWAESELRIQFQDDRPVDFTSVIAYLKTDSDVVNGMRARLMAAEGNYIDALNVTDSINGVERHSSRAIIFCMQAKWDETIFECEEGLNQKSLKHSTKQLFLILRVRARFSKAICYAGPYDHADAHLPASGPAGTDVRLIREVWNDIAEIITALRSSGWPANVELISDVWSATASILGQQKKAIPLMVEAARSRPTLTTLQASLESMAVQANEFQIALEANLRQPESTRSLQQQITLLHSLHRHQDCIKVLENKWEIISDDSEMFGFSLLHGIHSATKVIRPDLEKKWTIELESRPKLATHTALFHYFNEKINNPLNLDAALKDLIQQYEYLGRPKLLANHLLHELDCSIPEQAEYCIEVAKVLKSYSMLNINDLLTVAQAFITLARWDDLVRHCNLSLIQFSENDRLKAIIAIALDKLGKTAETHSLLTELIDKSNADELALTSYINIASRSGFIEQAITAIEKIYGDTNNPARSLECLRSMFILIQRSDPNSTRLAEIAWKIGELVDSNDESQEGIFLTAMFAGTVFQDTDLTGDRRNRFQQRLGEFTKKFPHSRILRTISIPSGATGEELVALLDTAMGANEEGSRERKRLLHDLKLGKAPIPYAWRPKNIIENIPDLPLLWEVSKRSSWSARHLHLTMATSEWKLTETKKISNQLPLLDLISLLVLFDLELLDSLFTIFTKIAIAKATLLKLQNSINPFSGCVSGEKLKKIEIFLKKNFSKIEQPEALIPDHLQASDNCDLFEIVELAKTGKYLIYSDDAFLRIYSQSESICTLDLIFALDSSKELSTHEAAKKISTLCSWRVQITVLERYQLAIIPNSVSQAKTVKECLSLIETDKPSSDLLGAIWNINKPFQEIQTHIATIVRKLASDDNNRLEVVAALTAFGLNKIRFHKDSSAQLEQIAALLITKAALFEEKISTTATVRLWKIYELVIEHINDNFMDDRRYRNSIQLLARISAAIDQKYSFSGDRSLLKRLGGSKTPGTSDFELFHYAYNKKFIELESREADI